MVLRISIVLFGFVLLFSSYGCSQENPEVSPEQVKQMLDKNEDVIIVDVRTAAEYTGELGHIPGAILKPLQEIEEWQAEFTDQKEDRIIIVCRTGNRSGVATQYFLNREYTNVYNMTGGMKAWNELSFPVTKEPAEE
jgi:rhodanese-related sulfurtransferase